MTSYFISIVYLDLGPGLLSGLDNFNLHVEITVVNNLYGVSSCLTLYHKKGCV